MPKKRKRKVYSTFKNGVRVHHETGIERKIRYLLKSMNLQFIPEAKVTFGRLKRYYDFLCYSEEEQWSFVIEVHGKHWHAQEYHEGYKKFSKLNKYQKRNVKNDELKKMILEKLHIPLLVIWEDDINLRLKQVARQIREFSDQLRGVSSTQKWKVRELPKEIILSQANQKQDPEMQIDPSQTVSSDNQWSVLLPPQYPSEQEEFQKNTDSLDQKND